MKLQRLPARVALAPQRLAISNSSWRAGKDGSTARGYGYRWQQYRLRFLGQHPLCVRCKADGRVEVATVVDHIRPHRGDPALFWDESNHQALCKRCHDVGKALEEHAAGQR